MNIKIYSSTNFNIIKKKGIKETIK